MMNVKKSAVQRKETVKADVIVSPISSPEDLIILKLLNGRNQDKLDADKILEIQNNRLDRKYMQQWAEKYGMQL